MQGNTLTEVYYHPIDAAIRWAGLCRYRQDILAAVPASKPWCLPETLDCPRCVELDLYIRRIYDAIFHGELPYGKNGITINDETLWESSDLTVRHVDLKRWMQQHYPGQRPPFLFSRSERIAHPVITLEAGHALLVEREALKSQLEQCLHQLLALQEQQKKQGQSPPTCTFCPLSDRAESTYLHIIGAMLTLMLGQSPSGTPYSSFNSQEAITSALIAHHGNLMGITERTLQGKFAQARRKLQSAVS
ncbi:TPA: hypothetical protein ACG4ML_000729 [Stenotrophomonas maltophilia]|jgi:hypothetical protein|uniref:hypothetical protein n=1 Tax=Burkholderia sp. LMG 13014 TaxID=2709306 RepID=UPI001965338B|nr:hypothetical protein [Burkholderia sp. LMG 13014]HDS1367593.1 hypothetical protein [Stenotrophomonas maltophilia]HEJ3242934.1 hypothetical protein [Pseudomonas aeruginosa]HDS1372260.1 hypothetical protein [Stenotrophomonas maltophilia]HDS1376577.1 hypothetical protein [Stenotrophomonas maltophilia]HDS1381431.1 hypothetical protein [Stenotrophomonas maltophilia]